MRFLEVLFIQHFYAVSQIYCHFHTNNMYPKRFDRFISFFVPTILFACHSFSMRCFLFLPPARPLRSLLSISLYNSVFILCSLKFFYSNCKVDLFEDYMEQHLFLFIFVIYFFIFSSSSLLVLFFCPNGMYVMFLCVKALTKKKKKDEEEEEDAN